MTKVIIVMGVSGSGKTVVGKTLAEKLEIPFFDADDFHPEANIQKMKSKMPLTDEDRKPWLLNLAKHIKEWQESSGAVLACSALKESYRQILTSTNNAIFWVVLLGDFELIKNRMVSRQGHYMKPEMLQSQFDTLEVPKYGHHVSIEKSVRDITNSILNNL